VLGLVLGQIAEQGFVRAWMIGGARGDFMGQLIINRPISWAIVALILSRSACRSSRRPGRRAAREPSHERDRRPDIAGAAVALGFGASAFSPSSRASA
jgi:putative tricarboxylic transport membrane protein